MATHVSLPYPTSDQGMDSVGHLAQGVLHLETIPQNELIQHGWIAAGFGLSKAFPPGSAMRSGLSPIARGVMTEIETDLAGGVDKINWASLVQKILTLVKLLLPVVVGCLVLALFCGTAAAEGPRPPQAPATLTKTFCTCTDPGSCVCPTNACACPKCLTKGVKVVVPAKVVPVSVPLLMTNADEVVVEEHGRRQLLRPRTWFQPSHRKTTYRFKREANGNGGCSNGSCSDGSSRSTRTEVIPPAGARIAPGGSCSKGG